MSSYSLSKISDSSLEKAKETALNRITRYRRAAEAARAIAKELDGIYVTKRIVDKILAAVPGAKRVYLNQGSYTDNVFVAIYYTDGFSEAVKDEIMLCEKKSRRLDASKLIQYAKGEELTAMEWENKLARLEENVNRYNEIAQAYAEIHSEIDRFFDDIPRADYDYSREYEAGVTPEQFLESMSA